MEPLSITVSITALLQVTPSIIIYLRDVHDAPDGQTKFAIEVAQLYSLLPVLRARVEQANPEDPWFAAVLALGDRDGPLDQLRSHLDKLALKLKPAKGVEGAWKRVTWGFTKTGGSWTSCPRSNEPSHLLL